MEIAEFLLARIAEDEAEIALGFDFATLDSSGWMGHAATWDRKRALTECEAKRRIVEEHAPFEHELAQPGRWCRMCVAPTGWPAPAPQSGVRFPCLTLRLLALPYAGHPDYREEWAAAVTASR